MIKRYIAKKDTTITNAFKFGNISKATGSNMGEADSLEIFSLSGRVSSGSLEKSRVLLEFPVSSITQDRTNNLIPASGSASFYLKMFNVPHHETTPKKFTLETAPVTQEWDEGYGVDLDNYLDPGIGNDGLGATWKHARSSSSGPVAWSTEGGDFSGSYRYTDYFEDGTEDLEIDITPLVESWIDGTVDNYGVGLFLTSSQEQNTSSISYFTKKFSARGSEYFFQKPVIEVRWDSSRKDRRNNFVSKEANFTSAQNTNDVYFYNFYRGSLTDLPESTASIDVNIFTDKAGSTSVATTPSSPLTPIKVETGVYKVSFSADISSEDRVHDVWSGSVGVYHTGTICPAEDDIRSSAEQGEYVFNIYNLKRFYRNNDKARFRVFTRKTNWQPNIVTVSNGNTQVHTVEDIYYRIYRVSDGEEIIPYHTGSNNSTLLSYDASGSYFDIDMSILEKDFTYGINLMYKDNSRYREVDDAWKFIVR